MNEQLSREEVKKKMLCAKQCSNISKFCRIYSVYSES